MKKVPAVSLVIAFSMTVITWMGCSKDDDPDDNDNQQPSVLFEGAFDSITTYPETTEITFVTQEGGLLKAEVFPGQIIIQVAGPSAEQVRELVVKNGGKIVVQVPTAGHYMAQIDPQKTSIFLNAMYKSPLVKLACPNMRSTGKANISVTAELTGTGSDGNINESAGNRVLKSSLGDAGSIIQTVDVLSSAKCGQMTHLEAVALTAAQSGVSVNTNDVTVETDENADLSLPFRKTIELIEYSYVNKTPVVINLSMGGDDSIPGCPNQFYTIMAWMLDSISRYNPQILDYAVIMMACTNNYEDETQEINDLKSVNPGSVLWNHLYFVGSEEGAGGCATPGTGLGFATPGTANYLTAPACDQTIPTTNCIVSGNSAAVPQVSGVIAKTYELLKQDNQTMQLWEVADALWQYQKVYSGTLPTPDQLVAFITGIVPVSLYDGTWQGTFQYSASVPQEEGPNVIVNTSFMITFTMKSEVSLPGYPHLLRFQAVTCSDPRFGATMAVLPDPQLSMAFLPGTYGSQSESGMAFLIEFPNGSTIFTNNTDDGSFTVDPTGNIIESTALVEDDAFLAATNIGDSNDPLSGPGLYAYNWCTFRHWKIVRVVD